MIKVLIVEDEVLATKRLKEMLADIAPDFILLNTFDSVQKCLTAFERGEKYDLIFMDVHLADGDCFDVFKNTPVTTPIIFTTAYDEYAIQAFKMYAVDYLLKPIKREELAFSIDKFRKLYPSLKNSDKEEVEIKNQNNESAGRWLIKMGQTLHLVAWEDVLYYFTYMKNTFLFTSDGKKLPLDLPLEQIEKTIDSRRYFRINRQYIISRESIEQMQTHSKARVRIRLKKSNEEVLVSVERSPAFRKWMVDLP